MPSGKFTALAVSRNPLQNSKCLPVKVLSTLAPFLVFVCTGARVGASRPPRICRRQLSFRGSRTPAAVWRIVAFQPAPKSTFSPSDPSELAPSHPNPAVRQAGAAMWHPQPSAFLAIRRCGQRIVTASTPTLRDGVAARRQRNISFPALHTANAGWGRPTEQIP